MPFRVAHVAARTPLARSSAHRTALGTPRRLARSCAARGRAPAVRRARSPLCGARHGAPQPMPPDRRLRGVRRMTGAPGGVPGRVRDCRKRRQPGLLPVAWSGQWPPARPQPCGPACRRSSRARSARTGGLHEVLSATPPGPGRSRAPTAGERRATPVEEMVEPVALGSTSHAQAPAPRRPPAVARSASPGGSTPSRSPSIDVELCRKHRQAPCGRSCRSP